jgi:hypothetical protein
MRYRFQDKPIPFEAAPPKPDLMRVRVADLSRDVSDHFASLRELNRRNRELWTQGGEKK